MAKSGRLEVVDNIYGHYRSIFNHCDVSKEKPNSVKNAKKVIQGHRGQYQSKARMRLIVTDNLSRTVAELSQLIVQSLDTAFLSHPLAA